MLPAMNPRLACWSPSARCFWPPSHRLRSACGLGDASTRQGRHRRRRARAHRTHRPLIKASTDVELVGLYTRIRRCCGMAKRHDPVARAVLQRPRRDARQDAAAGRGGVWHDGRPSRRRRGRGASRHARDDGEASCGERRRQRAHPPGRRQGQGPRHRQTTRRRGTRVTRRSGR